MKRIHVVAAVIQRGDQALIAKRPDHLHQGGKWEFPGGKVESNESIGNALARELNEELAIIVEHAEPLIKIAHNYVDKSVLLDVWRVNSFSGEPIGQEGQEIRWVKTEGLNAFEFPDANVPIVSAAQLPREYAITPEINGDIRIFLQKLNELVRSGVGCIQIRTKSISHSDWEQLREALRSLKEQYNFIALLNSDVPHRMTNEFDGVHLTSKALYTVDRRPEAMRWVSASCHNSKDLARAQSLGLDFVTLSALFATQSHPDVVPIGVSCFSEWVLKATLPVYALGGVNKNDLRQCIDLGAQGVAGIRGFWPESI